MANVVINQLKVIGYELFHGSENFLDELTSQDINSLEGGFGYGYGSYSGGFGGTWSGFSGTWSGFSGFGSWC